MKKEQLVIGMKVELDLEAINKSEYVNQLFSNETRKAWIITDVLDFHKTVGLKPTQKSKIEIVLPMSFIKEVI